jgi:small subunit ribosomal protein S1
VAIPGGIEGLIHASELGTGKSARLENFAIGQELQAKVIRIDQAERKVSLSLKALETDQERSDFDQYVGRQGSGSVSIGEMLEEKRRSREDD